MSVLNKDSMMNRLLSFITLLFGVLFFTLLAKASIVQAADIQGYEFRSELLDEAEANYWIVA